MRSIFNKLLLIGLSGVVLGACSTSADTKESSVQTTDETPEETVELAEETSIVAEEYGEDPEELYSDWLENVDTKWFGDYGNYAILRGGSYCIND